MGRTDEAALVEVHFHTGVADKLDYTWRLLRKAWRAGKQVVVTGTPDQLSRLDDLLWTAAPADFIPHARLRAGQTPSERLARTPIWLAERAADAGASDLLVNLGPAVVADHAGYERVIEIVAQAGDEVASGRQRWRHWLGLGITPINHAQPGA